MRAPTRCPVLALALLGAAGCRSSESAVPPAPAGVPTLNAPAVEVKTTLLSRESALQDAAAEAGGAEDDSESQSAQADVPDVSLPLAVEVGAGSPISLDQALTMAEARAPEIRVAMQRVNIAEADIEVARAAFLPQLTLGTDLFRHEGNTQATDGEIVDVNKQNAYLGAGVELVFDPGESLYRMRSAREEHRASRQGLRSVTNQVTQLAAARYFDLVEAWARLGIAEGTVRHAEELVALQEARVEGGSGLDVDLRRAEARLAQAQRGVITARSDTRTVSTWLVELLGLDPGRPLVPADKEIRPVRLVPVEAAGDLGPVEVLREQAQREHPDLAHARAVVRARQEEERGVEREWILPELRLGASYGGLGWNYSNDFDDQEIYRASLRWTVDLGMDGRRNRAHAARREAEAQAQRTLRHVDAAVVRAELEIRAAAERISAVRVESVAANEAWELARNRYESGAGLLIEVLDAEVGVVRADTVLVAAVSAYNRAQYELWAAIGGRTRDPAEE